ncbi:MAG: 2-dehydropantoate 2-reductase [Candidatus Hydrogenedentes bacterium ADurb.Bin170]|nr:MAG: 2-dehydropantoate 2-reductase [Candidatus Hydrogenedentes bacterium ADurb.Bin170]
MNILIMGAGALGSVAGGFLANKGHHVSLIGRRLHMDTVASQGLQIRGIWGEHRVEGMHVLSKPEVLPSLSFDLVLMAVKSYDTATAADLIAPYVSDNTLICSYQNGLGNAEVLAQKFGWNRVIGARVIFGARVYEPGAVEVTVMAAPTALGAYPGGPSEERIAVIVKAMADAGLPTVMTDEIRTLLWEKVAYNCALNPLSALLDVPYGALAESSYTRTVMAEVIEELYATAHRLRVPLKPDCSDAWLDHFYQNLLPPTAAHYASMREDLLRGRRTEIDALNGAIARFGNEQGISCPTNALLTALVHAREKTPACPSSL